MSEQKYCKKHENYYGNDCSYCLYGFGNKIYSFKDITKQIENFGKSHASYWGCALSGEVGEACNLIKKYERDNKDISKELPHELADIFIYLELTARFFNIDLEKAILEKIEIVNNRKK